MTKIIDITDSMGGLKESVWLSKAEPIHRQLRPLLPQQGYVEKMEQIFLSGGRMSIAVRGDEVVGVAVHRIYENTADGRMMYVDDLITDESKRSMGVGKILMDHLQMLALEAKCDHFKLDSGTHRQQAHKFYFREGLVIVAFHFLKDLRKGVL